MMDADSGNFGVETEHDEQGDQQSLGQEHGNCIKDLDVDESNVFPDEDGDATPKRVFASQRSHFSTLSYRPSLDPCTNGAHATYDFISLITTMSQTYRNKGYLPMRSLDSAIWKPLGKGTTFRVGGSKLKLSVASSRNYRVKMVITNDIVIKRNDVEGESMKKSQFKSFINELRVLSGLHGHPSIVQLQGVGWFYNEMSGNAQPIPKPVLMLEEAFRVLDYLIGPDVSLELGNLFGIFAQITLGISALHSCGIAHGDVKPDNILLFKTVAYRDGARIESYTAKLSDFGSSVFATSLPQYYPPGTKGYTAPEIGDAENPSLRKVPFEEIKATDVWSLGMLFAVVGCSPEDVLGGVSHISNVPSRIRYIQQQARRRVESSTLHPSMAPILPRILKHTLCVEQKERHLDAVRSVLTGISAEINNYKLSRVIQTLETSDTDFFCRSDTPDLVILAPMAVDELAISYENLKNVSGAVKDMIVNELQAIVSTKDPRRAKALWELGIIHLSSFAVPNSSPQQGLNLIRQAAENGDIRAKALHHRLHRAFHSPVKPIEPNLLEDWLFDAASVGHQVATQELQDLNLPRATAAQAACASLTYNQMPKIELLVQVREAPSVPKNNSLHRALATGCLEDARVLLEDPQINVNGRDAGGDTPLISACRFGQYSAVTLLLQFSPDASLINDLGENALHFAWCFKSAEAELVVRQLHRAGAGLDQVAKGRSNFSDLDVLPMLPGTPLERSIGRRRLDLVTLFLDLGGPIIPSNGNVARRVLLWAFRLHDRVLQDLLLDILLNDVAHNDQTLAPLEDTTWLFKGEERTLLEAVCAGWLSGSGFGCDMPFCVWLASCNGRRWRDDMRSSLVRVLDLNIRDDESKERLLDRAIPWVFRESNPEIFISLLDLKISLTSGFGSRLRNFETLLWKLNTPNVCTM